MREHSPRHPDPTLCRPIRDRMDSLAGIALEAARSRGQKQAGPAHLLYALYMDEGLTGQLLRAHGVKSGEIRRLMGEIPNRPLGKRGNPVPDAPCRRILAHANDTVEILRRIQDDEQVAALLASHGIDRPALQPTQGQVTAAADTGMRIARTLGLRHDRKADVDQLAYTRLMLEAALAMDERKIEER